VRVLSVDARTAWEDWRGTVGPPVPVIIEPHVWQVLRKSAISTRDPLQNPKVFRLFMRRRSPRHVIEATEIKQVWRNQRGVIRWKEGEYPLKSGTLRKGGNAFLRGDVILSLNDAWWMGMERTDFRILMQVESDTIKLGAWWARGGSGGLGTKYETDGDVRPVRLLIKEPR
jgi:hypothetical protein